MVPCSDTAARVVERVDMVEGVVVNPSGINAAAAKGSIDLSANRNICSIEFECKDRVALVSPWASCNLEGVAGNLSINYIFIGAVELQVEFIDAVAVEWGNTRISIIGIIATIIIVISVASIGWNGVDASGGY